MELFRKYCIGDGEVTMQVVSDPLKTLVTPARCVPFPVHSDL
jgi:hypothetical protein